MGEWNEGEWDRGHYIFAILVLSQATKHTTVEMVHREDVENVIKMIYETLLKIKGGETFSYFAARRRIVRLSKAEDTAWFR